MRAFTNVLLASATVLGSAGCLPDFSPDPQKSDVDRTADGAVLDRDASAGDAGSDAGPRDSGPAPVSDSGPAPVTDASTDNGAPMGCDLSGKYWVNEHWLTNVAGAQQMANNWFYYEIVQKGTDLTVMTSTGCGSALVGIGLAASTDDSRAWPAYASHKSYEGRKGTVMKTDTGCMVNFDRDAVIHGATVDYYKNEANVMTTDPISQAGANGMPPGWEDWDADGKPGVTLTLGGLASGDLYIASRAITTYDGAIALNAAAGEFKLHMAWEQTRSTLGAMPDSFILRATAGRDPDESRQFVQFAKVTTEQIGTGSPADICNNLRDLALNGTITVDAQNPMGTNP